MTEKNKLIKPILAGFVGMIVLSGAYWLILYLVSGEINHPWQQFLMFKYWMSALILGCGIQFSLYLFVKSGLHLSGGTTKISVATGATTSTAVSYTHLRAHETDSYLVC